MAVGPVLSVAAASTRAGFIEEEPTHTAVLSDRASLSAFRAELTGKVILLTPLVLFHIFKFMFIFENLCYNYRYRSIFLANVLTLLTVLMLMCTDV